MINKCECYCEQDIHRLKINMFGSIRSSSVILIKKILTKEIANVDLDIKAYKTTFANVPVSKECVDLLIAQREKLIEAANDIFNFVCTL